jgi:hypothetical protein
MLAFDVIVLVQSSVPDSLLAPAAYIIRASQDLSAARTRGKIFCWEAALAQNRVESKSSRKVRTQCLKTHDKTATRRLSILLKMCPWPKKDGSS